MLIVFELLFAVFCLICLKCCMCFLVNEMMSSFIRRMQEKSRKANGDNSAND